MTSTALDRRTQPDALLLLTVLVVAGWAGVAALGAFSVLVVAVPAAVVALLFVVVLRLRAHSGLDARELAFPPLIAVGLLVMAVTCAVAWWVLDDADRAATASVASLTMATPGALAMAAPSAFSGGLARARSGGVRLGGLEAVAAAARADTLVLPKDGTLTTGDLTVVSVDPIEPDHDRNLRWFAGALEKASDHRIARAISKLAARGRLDHVETVSGFGITGRVDRHPVRVGAPDWIGVTTTDTIWQTVGVEVDGRPIGSITVADDLRVNLRRDVQRLAGLGLHLVVVADDTDPRTQHAAREAGIDAFHGSSGPDELAQVVAQLTADGKTVAVAGPAPVAGTAVELTTDAAATSPTTIVTDDLSPSRITAAIGTARGTASAIRRSQALALVLGVVGAGAGATGLVGPLVAAATAAAIFTAVAISTRLA